MRNLATLAGLLINATNPHTTYPCHIQRKQEKNIAQNKILNRKPKPPATNTTCHQFIRSFNLYFTHQKCILFYKYSLTFVHTRTHPAARLLRTAAKHYIYYPNCILYGGKTKIFPNVNFLLSSLLVLNLCISFVSAFCIACIFFSSSLLYFCCSHVPICRAIVCRSRAHICHLPTSYPNKTYNISLRNVFYHFVG